MKMPKSKWMTVIAALSALGAMAYVSQGCTVVTSDNPLDGGNFYGNDAAAPPVFNACNECLFQQCTGQFAVCQNSPDCLAIYQCATAPSCNGGTCVDDCVKAHPAGYNKYLALATCDQSNRCGSTCSASCTPTAAECPNVQPDAGTPDTGTPDADTGDAGTPDSGPVADGGSDSAPPAQTCSECTATKCTNEKAACATGTDCDKYTACLVSCTDEACINRCDATFPAGKMASSTLATCVTTNCADACKQ